MAKHNYTFKSLVGKCKHRQTVPIIPNKGAEWVCGICGMINQFKTIKTKNNEKNNVPGISQ